MAPMSLDRWCQFFLLKIKTHVVAGFLLDAAAVLAIYGLNEYFGVGVVSGAMDGAAPELNPGWVHRRNNTYPEVRHAHCAPAL